jgi:hypothetical protein
MDRGGKERGQGVGEGGRGNREREKWRRGEVRTLDSEPSSVSELKSIQKFP